MLSDFFTKCDFSGGGVALLGSLLRANAEHASLACLGAILPETAGVGGSQLQALLSPTSLPQPCDHLQGQSETWSRVAKGTPGAKARCLGTQCSLLPSVLTHGAKNYNCFCSSHFAFLINRNPVLSELSKFRARSFISQHPWIQSSHGTQV